MSLFDLVCTHDLCIDHGPYVRLYVVVSICYFVVNVCSIHCRCNTKSVKEKGGAYCEVDIFEEISSVTGSQTTDEDM